MNRSALLLVLVILTIAACKPKRVDLAAFGKRLLHVAPAVPVAVPPVTPPTTSDPPVEQPPVVDHHVHHKAPPAAKPSKVRPPVTTPPAARPPAQATFAAHARTQGGTNSCTAHPTMEQCTTHCTSVLRTSSMDPSPAAIRSCNCVERGC